MRKCFVLCNVNRAPLQLDPEGGAPSRPRRSLCAIGMRRHYIRTHSLERMTPRRPYRYPQDSLEVSQTLVCLAGALRRCMHAMGGTMWCIPGTLLLPHPHWWCLVASGDSLVANSARSTGNGKQLMG